MKVATGEYIAFVDSDDYVDLDMFESMYNSAKKLSFFVIFQKNTPDRQKYKTKD